MKNRSDKEARERRKILKRNLRHFRFMSLKLRILAWFIDHGK